MLEDRSIDWASHGIEPRWLGMESSDCAAALDPSIFHGRGADELSRFIAGTSSRNEMALVINAIGDTDASGHRNPFASSADDSILLPGLVGSISARRLPAGAQATLAPGIAGADRDLGLRLLNRPTDAPWWSLTMSGNVQYSGAGGEPFRTEPTGRLEPILVDGLGHPVVAAWNAHPEHQRWYVIPSTPWAAILDWLVQHAMPEYVPAALRRARSPHALDPALQTPAEESARLALAKLEATYSSERQRLNSELAAAQSTAEPLRHGLLYGTAIELENAVAAVLEAAGFNTTRLDKYLGDTTSADLLVAYGSERRLVEIKSASGNASEALVGHLARHLATWPKIRPGERVDGGVLVVNHQHRLEPDQRSPAVYARPEFVASLTVPVLSSRQLYDWWRDSDWNAIRGAVLVEPPKAHEPSNGLSAAATAPQLTPAAQPSRRGWRRRRAAPHTQETPES